MNEPNDLTKNQQEVITKAGTSPGETNYKSHNNKTPLFLGFGVLLLLLGGGGVFLSQLSPVTSSVSPTVTPAKSNPINMKTFNSEDIEPFVTLENATDVTLESEAAIKYGLDNDTLNKAVRDAFAAGLQ